MPILSQSSRNPQMIIQLSCRLNSVLVWYIRLLSADNFLADLPALPNCAFSLSRFVVAIVVWFVAVVTSVTDEKAAKQYIGR